MDDVDWTMQQGGKYIDELRDHVNSLMIGTIEEMLDTWYSDEKMSYDSQSSWILQLPPHDHAVSYTHLTLPTILLV